MSGMTWVRVLVGAVWLNGGLEKLLNPDFPREFAASLQAGGFVSAAPAFFRVFMQNNVVPNAELVAQVVRAAELAMGVALILGLFTNLAALGSVALSVMILLSQGGVSLGTGLGSPQFFTINVVMAALSLIILFSPAAKEASLDAGLSRRRPGLSPLLTNTAGRRRRR